MSEKGEIQSIGSISKKDGASVKSYDVISVESIKMEDKPAEILNSEMPLNAEVSASSVLIGNFVDPNFTKKLQAGTQNQADIDKFIDDNGPIAESMYVMNKN